MHRFLNTPKKNKRLSKLHAKTRAKDQSIKRLEKRLEEAIERRGLEVDESLHKDHCATISHTSSEVKEKNSKKGPVD
jgi:hypothetical protein